MKKQMNLVMNGKGGVGKSLFANNFVQYLKDHQIEHLAIDTDNENSTLKRFHPEAEFVNVGNARELDLLFSSLEQHSLVVVDCRAASTDIFLDYFAEIRAFDVLEALGGSLTVITPVNHEADSIEQVKLIAESLGGQCRYVVVKNQAHSEQFRIYDRSNTRRRVVEELGGIEIIMPKLYDWLVTTLNETNLSLTAAIGHSDVPLIDRQRLKNWQLKFNEQVELARRQLLPSSIAKSEARRRKSKSEE